MLINDVCMCVWVKSTSSAEYSFRIPNTLPVAGDTQVQSTPVPRGVVRAASNAARLAGMRADG
jgi:hypothetical protein